MTPRNRAKQLAKRTERLLAAIRVEVGSLESSSDLPVVGVLSFVEEAAVLLKQAGLRMGWWISDGEAEAARLARSGPQGELTGDEVYATFRYVAVQAPSLAPILAWAVASSPELVAVLASRPPAPGELAALAALDETLAAIVRASPAGFRRSGQVWRLPWGTNGSVTPVSPPPPPLVSATDVACSLKKVARLRPALVPACLWTIFHRPATRLAVSAYLPKPEELAELSEMAREDAEAEPGAAGPGGPYQITEAETKDAFVALAVKLDKIRAEVQALIHGLDREWPEAIVNGHEPPDLSFWLFGAAENVAELLDEAIARAWEAADDTEESVRSEWLARNQVSRAERTAELLSEYAETAEPEGFVSSEIARVAEDVETRVLPLVVEGLNRLKMTVLAARSRLPRHYPELKRGESSRPAVLHGDLGILVGALDEALSQARTTATGVLQE